jgi:hypothetical protein
MRRNKAKPVEFILFNVFYEDGSQSSNRKVPSTEVGGLDGEAPILAFLEAQDREIGEKSGRPRATIKSIERSDR